MPAEPIWFHPEAIREVRSAREWHNVLGDEVADAFMAEMDSAVERIDRIEILAVAHARRRPGYWLGG